MVDTLRSSRVLGSEREPPLSAEERAASSSRQRAAIVRALADEVERRCGGADEAAMRQQLDEERGRSIL